MLRAGAVKSFVMDAQRQITEELGHQTKHQASEASFFNKYGICARHIPV